MKNKLRINAVLGVAFLLFIAACKKEDVLPATPDQPVATTAAASNRPATSRRSKFPRRAEQEHGGARSSESGRGAARFVTRHPDRCRRRTRRQSHRRRGPVRAGRHGFDHVCPGRNLGHGEFQGDAARRDAARTRGDAFD